MKTTYSLLFVSGLCLLAVPVQAAVTMPKVFADHMVLQRDMPVAVWGWADAGEKVTVSFGKQSKTAVPDATGRWQVALDAMPANATAQELIIIGTNTVVIRDVLVGEVWFCSGQSNMNTLTSENPKEILDREIPKAELPTLRLFASATALGPTVQKDLSNGQWVLSTPKTALNYSGVAFFFGREIHNALKVPVGLVKVGCGGSKCESWTGIEGLQDDPAYQKTLKAQWEKKLAEYPAVLQKYNEVTLPNWEKAVAQAKTDGKPTPIKPGKPNSGPDSAHCPASLFNHLVAPLVGLSMRGVIWYQGESNASSPEESKDYRTLFPAMINDWRKRWQRPDMPFLFVQIANFRAAQTQPVETPANWALAREAQAMALSLPNTGMATAIDINHEPDNIHPTNKYDVGLRLSFVALAKVYGKDIPYAGPTFDKMTIEGSKARLHFTHTDGGLKTRDGGPVKGVAIADQAGAFVWADAVIDGNTLVLSSPESKAPAKVRYGWAMNPIGNLDNGVGLPAFPFRTDTEQSWRKL
ncbi:MAG: sialate O-acetylesterase [bacterium]